MCVALIGKLDGDEWSCREAAYRAGFEVWLLSGQEINIASKIKGLDAMVIIPEKVSHREVEDAINIAVERNIPVMCARCEGAALCGITQMFYANLLCPSEIAIPCRSTERENLNQ